MVWERAPRRCSREEWAGPLQTVTLGRPKQTWQVAGETSQYGLGFKDDGGTRVWSEKNGVHQLMKTRRTRLLLPSHLEMQSPCLAIQIAAV